MAREHVRDTRRSQILDAFETVLSTGGMGQASITDIATTAGLPRGAIHHFFESKGEIVTALMQRMGERYVGALGDNLQRRILANAVSVSGDLVRFHFLGDEQVAYRRLSVWIDYWGTAASDVAVRSVVSHVQSQARHFFAQAMQHDRPELARCDTVTKETYAAALLSLVEGALLQWRFAQPDNLSLRREQLSAHTALAATLLVNALPVCTLTSPSARRLEIA